MRAADDPDQPSAPRAPRQRGLELALRVGLVAGVVGLVTLTVIIVLFLRGAEPPGTWAYLLAMLAPLGFGVVLLALLAAALRRRRDGLHPGQPGAPGQPTG